MTDEPDTDSPAGRPGPAAQGTAAAPAPTRVVLTSIGPGQWTDVAEFTITDGKVSLTVLDPTWAALAQRAYVKGVSSDAQGRVVPRSEPEAFMRALLEAPGTSYFRYVDRSDHNPGQGGDGGDGHPAGGS
jgi:hypothetical protein